MIRAWFRRQWVAHRRRRLLAAYAKEFKIRTGKSHGFTPTIYALQEAERDGLLDVKDGEVEWRWPDGG